MDLERGLKDWQAAGFIDATAADAIREYEGRQRTPWGRWAIISLGLLAVALGIALLIAANWWDIPDALKLAVQMTLSVMAAIAIFYADRRGWSWTREGVLFLFGALVLGGIALQTQIFQLKGASWQALWFWMAMMAPAFLLIGRSRLNGYAFALMAGWAALALGTDVASPIGRGIAMAVPAALIGVSALGRDMFVKGLREAGLFLLLTSASVAHIAWSVRMNAKDVAEIQPALVVGVVISALMLALLRWRRDPAAAVLLPVCAAAIVAVLVTLGLPHEGEWMSRLIGALVYAAMWGIVGWVAFRAGWTQLFGVAVAALAFRLFIIYFEIFASLAMTGAGLIGAGLLLIALVQLWRRLTGKMGRA